MASMAKDTIMLDRMIARAAARYVVNDYDFTSSVTQMLKTLSWQTLEQRRIQNSVIIHFKINHYLVVVDHHHLTESRNLNFLVPYSRSYYHINSFFPRTIRYRNMLPYNVKTSTSLAQFTVELATIHFWL